MSVGGLAFKLGRFQYTPWVDSYLTGSDGVPRNGLHLNFLTMKYDVLGAVSESGNSVYWYNAQGSQFRGTMRLTYNNIQAIVAYDTSNQNGLISVATRISNNNFAHTVDGGPITANGAGAIMPPRTLDLIRLASPTTGVAQINEHIEKIRIIPRALSNTELRDLANTG